MSRSETLTAVRFVPSFDLVGDESGAVRGAEERIVVLDSAWTRTAGSDVIGIRDVAASLLKRRNLYREATELLDGWAEASGIADLLTVDGTSLWYQARPGHWWWLQERLFWLGIVDALVQDLRPQVVICGPGTDEALASAVRLTSRRDGFTARFEGGLDAGRVADDDVATGGPGGEGTLDRPDVDPARSTMRRRAWPIRLLRRAFRQVRPEERVRRRRVLLRRLGSSSRGRLRIMVLSEHVRQVIGAIAEHREINPYLDPILDHLTEAGLDWLVLEPRVSSADDATWDRVRERADHRLITGDLLRTFDEPGELAAAGVAGAVAAAEIAAISTPLVADGVDLGPDLVARLSTIARESLGRRAQNITRQRRFLHAARPAALLLADEYQRQEWLAAARLGGIPTVAVQHGGIQRWHVGYIHRSRPDHLTLPDRTYVFGEWERRLLVGHSVYREAEVIVGGSPRLDLVSQPAPEDSSAVRTELGIDQGSRLVVISTTWGPLLRRFHFVVAIARLVEQPLPRVHLVVKLHPSEPDDGLYRRLIDGVARAMGHEPPPLTVVKTIDLYRLLGAADAHVGLYSTVLTEAVVTGTPNFIVGGIEPFDLMGYVDAGVATPIVNGAELLAALDAGLGVGSPAARRAFLDDHFEPGFAGPRIAADLAGWLEASDRPSSPGGVRP